MKVSIIIPVYNVSAYIERSLKSALNQSYPNIEYILINDGSPDDSFDKVKAIVSQSERKDQVVLHDQKENKGIAITRNKGLDLSSGDYLFYLDSDDELPLDSIEKLMLLANEFHPSFVIGNYEVLKNNESKVFKYKNKSIILSGESVLNTFLKKGWNDMPCNKLLSKDLFLDGKCRFMDNIVHEDTLWCFELAQNTSSIVYCDDITYIYHIRSNSITQKKNKKNFDSTLIVLDEIIKDSLAHNLFEKHPLIADYIIDMSFYTLKELVKFNDEKKIIIEYILKIRNRIHKIPDNYKKKVSLVTRLKLFMFQISPTTSIRLIKLIYG